MIDGANIQHRPPFRPESGFGFDDAGERVPIEQPDDEPATAAGLDLEPLLEVLLCSAKTPREIAERVLFLAYLMPKVTRRPKSLRELATFLGVSQVTAMNRVNRFRQCFPAICAEVVNSAPIGDI